MTATTLNVIAQGTLTTLLSTEINSLANNAYGTLGGAFNNAFSTSNFNGYPLGDVMLNLAAYTGTPTAGSSVNIWFIPAIDGTNYDNSGSTISIPPNIIIPVDALTSGPYQRTVKGVLMPVGLFKTLALNNGTGIAFASSGNTVKIAPTSLQGQ